MLGIIILAGYSSDAEDFSTAFASLIPLEMTLKTHAPQGAQIIRNVKFEKEDWSAVTPSAARRTSIPHSHAARREAVVQT